MVGGARSPAHGSEPGEDAPWVDPQAVGRARSAMPDGEAVLRLAEVFSVLGDPSRVKLISALAAAELCVGDLAGLAGLSQSAVSHQLRLLRATRLVNYRREGPVVYYSLGAGPLRELFSQGLHHLKDRE